MTEANLDERVRAEQVRTIYKNTTPGMMITAYSARCRPLIPPHAGPRFRAMPAGDSAACRPLLEVIPSRG